MATSTVFAPFRRGDALPYSLGGVPVTAATPGRNRSRLGHSSSNSTVHRIDALAVAWLPGGPQLCARWLCQGTATSPELLTTAISDAVGPESGCTGCEQMWSVAGQIGPCVYRVWTDKRTKLLYVGATSNWPARRRAHRANTWWWMDLARAVDIEMHPSMEAAFAAEKAAIKSEGPAMNVQHNKFRAVS
jgi:hypothetical protein